MKIDKIVMNGINANGCIGYTIFAGNDIIGVEGFKGDTPFVQERRLDMLEHRLNDQQKRYAEASKRLTDIAGYINDIYPNLTQTNNITLEGAMTLDDEVISQHSLMKSFMLLLEGIRKEIWQTTVAILWVKYFMDPYFNDFAKSQK